MLPKSLTLEEAKNLERGTVLYSLHYFNADGTPERWRVNGIPKTWKRSPDRVEIPVKRGMYEYSYVTEHDLENFTLEDWNPKEIERRYGFESKKIGIPVKDIGSGKISTVEVKAIVLDNILAIHTGVRYPASFVLTHLPTGKVFVSSKNRFSLMDTALKLRDSGVNLNFESLSDLSGKDIEILKDILRV